jgi:hypothetical protein
MHHAHHRQIHAMGAAIVERICDAMPNGENPDYRYPNVNEKACTPESKNSISNVRSLIGPFCRMS